MNKFGKNAGRVLAAVAFVVALDLGASTAAGAATITDNYQNTVTKKYEGYVKWLDCNCPGDGNLTVDNVKNGYAVRARFYAYVGGSWARYLDKTAPDGAQATWSTGYPPAGAQVHLQLCFLDSKYVQRGTCWDYYNYNTYY